MTLIQSDRVISAVTHKLINHFVKYRSYTFPSKKNWLCFNFLLLLLLLLLWLLLLSSLSLLSTLLLFLMLLVHTAADFAGFGQGKENDDDDVVLN